MYPCSNELIVQQNIPLRVHRFPTAMRHERLARAKFSIALRSEVLECVRELPTIHHHQLQYKVYSRSELTV